MKKFFLTIVLALGIAIAPGIADAAGSRVSDRPYWMKKSCQYEDSVNCFWDAGSSGNKKGHSFIVRQVPGKAGMVCVFYIQKAYAKKHDYCS